ncbi:alpha-1,4-glucosidase [Aureococcus anophagefferens]|nr:alpha-1,4-glucosidase [Aureococcus anophagefferens]
MRAAAARCSSARPPRRPIVFETLPNDSFLRVGRGSLDVNATIYNGALYREPKLGDNVSAPNSNVVDRVVGPSAVGAGPATVAIYGSVGTGTARVAYRFALTSAPGELNLRWACEAAVDDDPRSFLSVRVASPAAEEIYGFGMTYSRWNLKNLTFPVIASEQGVGRGLEPVTTAINAFGGEQGGDWHTTYSACSSYVTSLGRGLVVDSTRVGVVDLGAAGGAALELSYFGAAALEGAILVAADAAGPRRLLAVVAALSNVTGRMAPLPAWVDRGAIVGTEGGSAFVDDVVANLTAFDVPLAGIWLQDWTGLVDYTEGQRVLWNWELSDTWYPDWRRQTRRWREALGAPQTRTPTSRTTTRYALDWADAVAAAGGDGDLLWFDRSATSRSPGAARLMWMGDQLHTLDEKDGLHSAVVALLQSGLSGFSLGHSDVGGYTTVDVPLARFPRSAAVLMRWAESSAFSDAVFRTHPGSLPRENVQVYSDAAGCVAPHRGALPRVG